MSLDKFTLHHQLAVLNNNLASLDTTIKSTTEQIQQLSLSLERLRGAREYHGLLVDQVNQAIAVVEQEEKAAILAAETSAAAQNDSTKSSPTPH